MRSLIRYATLCDYMLVPTEEERLPQLPHGIPGYGSRGWCRVEYFIFSLAAEMRGREEQFKNNGVVPGKGAQLYGIKRDGSLEHYPRVMVSGRDDMPSQGALSNPNDKALVQDLEDTMIEAYGKVMVETTCKAGAGGKASLEMKMIRACHVEALFEAVNKYEVKVLFLSGNQLGDAAAKAIAAMLRTNRSLTRLDLNGNNIGDAGAKAIAAMLRTNRSLTILNLKFNKIGDAGKKAVIKAVKFREGFTLWL